MCGGATGEVLEIGFGPGRNLSYYPAAVSRVLAVEPAELSWQRAQARVTASGMPVERVGLDGAHPPRVAGWQRRVQPVWGPLAGGCHVDRDVAAAGAGAGLDVDLSYAGFIGGGPATPWLWFVSGSATPA